MDKQPKKHFLFIVSLVYILIPLFNANNYNFPGIIVICLTLLFIGAYLGTLKTMSPYFSNVYWAYMIGYIVVMTLQNIMMAMFIAYLSNLFSWYYNDTLTSKRALSIWGLALFVFGVIVMKPDDFVDKVIVMNVVIFALALMITFYQFNQQEKLKKQVYEKNETINLLLADTERQRIRRDLHDSLGHIFALLTIKSELSLALLQKQEYEKLQEELVTLRQVSQQSMKDVRKIIEKIDSHTINEELIILNDMLSLADINVTVSSVDFSILSLDYHKQISLMLREFGNNIIKHSQATQCSFMFEYDTNYLIISVEDNGIGFSKQSVVLQSIQQRVFAMNGTLLIESIKLPTKIITTLPLEI